MRTFCGLAAAFLLAVAPGVRAQLDSAPTPVPLPIPIAGASTAMPAQDLDALRAVHAREINDLSTFKTAGLPRQLSTPISIADQDSSFCANCAPPTRPPRPRRFMRARSSSSLPAAPCRTCKPCRLHW